MLEETMLDQAEGYVRLPAEVYDGGNSYEECIVHSYMEATWRVIGT